MFPLEPEMGICHVSLPPKHCDLEWTAEINRLWLQVHRPGGGSIGLCPTVHTLSR